ncbi:unnamed protein product [Microthlaspi erraticum]|uniref:Uncharacterized protein n=1 Tax=Microthlaspi erraticum TaxID=1685480 RepID=A0A6D2LLG8_9BRAS|nr:unnamed protein product [Microthlaspi erraticum]
MGFFFPEVASCSVSLLSCVSSSVPGTFSYVLFLPSPNIDSVSETETQENEETESKKRPLEERSSSRNVDTKCIVKKEEKTNMYFKRVWTEEDEIILLQKINNFGSHLLKSKIRFYVLVESKISFKFGFKR